MQNEDTACQNPHSPSAICHLPLSVTYDPSLIETIVRRRVDMGSKEDKGWIAEYRAELDDIYEMPETPREAAFVALDRRYFQRIGIPSVVDECLAERAASISGAVSVYLLNARNKSEEGVDVTRDRHVVIRFRPSTLEFIEVFRQRLRRELIQASDCLNPSFGHAPELLDGMLPSEKERIRGGLSALWALSAQTRLCSRDLQIAKDFPMDQVEELERLRKKALGVFAAMAAGDITALLSGLPDRPPTFRELLDFCRTRLSSEQVAAGICDLCRFPSEDVAPFHSLEPSRRVRLKSEFPDLQPASPVCRRCVERTELI